MEVKYDFHPTLGEHGERELPTLQKSGVSERWCESAGIVYNNLLTLKYNMFEKAKVIAIFAMALFL